MAKKARTTRRVQDIMEATSRRVAIYLRRSTDEENQPYSLEAQETRLRAFTDSQPGEWTIVAVYSDDASGATTDRPDLEKMLRAARAGLFDTLLVYRVDRLSRRLGDLVTLLDELTDANVAFRSATEPFDTSTPVGRMLVQMLGVFAEFEREVIIDRVIAGMERKAAKGRWTGGTRPYGYVVDKAADKLAILELEAATVRLVFDSYTRDRLGTQAIATLLNDQGLRTRAGKPWSQRAVEVMVTNRVYIGEMRFRDITAVDAHEPIISKDQFDLAQRILAKRSAEAGRRGSNPSDYTLTGKIRCPDCGRKYIGTVAHGRYNRYRYYVCWTRDRYGTKAGCAVHRFSADELEAAVSAAMIEFYTTRHDVISEAVTNAQAAHARATSGHRDRLAAVSRDLKENTAAIDRYLGAFERGTLDDRDETVQNRLTTLKEQSKRLRARKAQLEFELDQPPTAPTPGDLIKIGDHIRDVLTRGTPAARKALFESLIDDITVNSDDTVTPRFRVPMLGKDEGLDLQGPALPETRTTDVVRALPHPVEPRGLEPLTPTLPVWCATSCATAPRARSPGHSQDTTRPSRGSRTGIPPDAPGALATRRGWIPEEPAPSPERDRG
jgi:site-specific DNA recombinase